MSALAYSQLLKRIAGVEERKLEQPFKILTDNNTTSTRLKVIKVLARYGPISVGKALQKANLPTGGGSYLTMQKYFQSLEKEGLLISKKVWNFTKSAEDLKRYIQN